MTSAEGFEIHIPSDTAQGQEIQERIVSLLERLNYPPRDVFGMRLALEEAIVNAIKHGNCMDVTKRVRISCAVSLEKVRVEIEDEGQGFCEEDVPDPTTEENLERPCGRGIMLMKAFLNVCEYNEQGNRVILEKHRGIDADNGSCQ